MTTAARRIMRNGCCDLCVLAVAGIFLYAAALKIIEPRQFVFDVKNYRIVPEPLLHLVVLLLPWWEVGAAAAFVAPRTRRAGAILLAAMLLTFIAAVSYAALYKGYNISCGCFGKGSAQAGFKTIGLDVGLLLAVWIGLLPRKKPVYSSAFPVVLDQGREATAPPA